MALTSGVGGATNASIAATKTALAKAATKATPAKVVPKVYASPLPAKAPAQTAQQLAAERAATQSSFNMANTNEPTTSLRGSLMPQAQPDGSYLPWSTPATAAPAWTLEGDPVYQAAMSAGQASFNYARNAALADKQNTETAKAAERKALDVNATEARRRTAGNYAARGMAGGAAGALSQAEALANARQIAAQTSIADQLSAVNNQYLQNYGAIGSDWTGTLVGQQYKTQAAQQALDSALARYGTV